jgi:surface antigen
MVSDVIGSREGVARRGKSPRSLPRRLLRTALLSVAVLLGLLLLAEGVLPAAAAFSLPVRVVKGHTRLTEAGPAATQYPYRSGASPFALDPNGFVVGECTSFVAWWLGAHRFPLAVITVGPRGTGSFLNASSWDTAARTAGFAVGRVPVVGAVAHWQAGERSHSRDPDGRRWESLAGRSGHVAVVVAVLPDGQAEWVEYGWKGKAVLHRGRGWAPRYLYLGVTPPSSPAEPVAG